MSSHSSGVQNGAGASAPSDRLDNRIDFDVQTCRAEKDIVAGLQPQAARSGRDRNRFAGPDNAGAVCAAVIEEAEFPGAARAFDVGMIARDAQVRLFSAIRERHVIRADQPIQAIADFRAPSQIDARSGEHIVGPLRHSLCDRQFQRAAAGLRRRQRQWKAANAIELDVEPRRRPMRLCAIDITRADAQSCPIAAGRLNAVDDPLLQGRLRSQYRFEARPRLCGIRANKDSDLVERENVLSAPSRLDALLDSVDDGMHDFEWFTRLALRELLRRVIDGARQAGFQTS